jgi:hypothetical protein
MAAAGVSRTLLRSVRDLPPSPSRTVLPCGPRSSELLAAPLPFLKFCPFRPGGIYENTGGGYCWARSPPRSYDKHVMRCSRYESIPERNRGKSFQRFLGAIRKVNEHIAVSFLKIRPNVSNANSNLRHTLLINMAAKHVASMNKKAQFLRKLRLPHMTLLVYVLIGLLVILICI